MVVIDVVQVFVQPSYRIVKIESVYGEGRKEKRKKTGSVERFN